MSTAASKINVTPRGVYLPISKLHSFFAVVNLLAHNKKSQICYCGQISLQSGADNQLSDNLTPLGITFILLAMVPYTSSIVTIYWRKFAMKMNVSLKSKIPYQTIVVYEHN